MRIMLLTTKDLACKTRFVIDNWLSTQKLDLTVVVSGTFLVVSGSVGRYNFPTQGRTCWSPRGEANTVHGGDGHGTGTERPSGI